MASISALTPAFGCSDCIDKLPLKQQFNSGTAQPVDQITLCPELGLVDDEGLLVLPPEDTDEESSNEQENEEASCVSNRHCINNSIDRVSDCSSVQSFGTSQKHRKRRKRAYAVNLSNCKYESVRRVLRRFGFREVEEDDDWNLYWTDYSVSLDRVVAMKAWQKINHFPGMSELCRKDSLARNLCRMAKMFPKDYAIFPRTWCLPSDWNELQNYARKRKSKTYIFKPDTGCQGRGIYLTKSVKDMRPMDNMICQVYLSKPFVIDGYKFDLRLYILLTSCDPLRMFMYKDGLVRFTTVQYAEPNNRNVNNLFMHLTNYALQKHSNEYIRDDEEGGTKRRVTTLNRWLRENGYDLQKVWADIDDVIIKTVLSGYAVLRHNYRTCFPNHVQTSACFEILGFDIMLNHKLKPYILEVNHSPSFSTDSKLDKEIKEALLWDTLQLAHFGMINKKKCIEDERKRIRSRLLQKTVRKDVREMNEKDLAHFNEAAEKYERNHLGNYRMIYPPADKEKYEKFLNPHATFYQETVTYKVRSECARQMREEIKLKQGKLDALQHKGRPIGPESPAPKKLASKSRTVKSRSQTVSGAERSRLHHNPPDEAQRTWGDQEVTSDSVTETVDVAQSGDGFSSWKAQPIVAEEEESRLEALRQRERLMHAVGLVEAIHRLLAGSSGVISTVGASVRAKMPRNMGEKHLKANEVVQNRDQIPRSLGAANQQVPLEAHKSTENTEAFIQMQNFGTNSHTSGIRECHAMLHNPGRRNPSVTISELMSEAFKQPMDGRQCRNNTAAVIHRVNTGNAPQNRNGASMQLLDAFNWLSSISDPVQVHLTTISNSDTSSFCRGFAHSSLSGTSHTNKPFLLRQQIGISSFSPSMRERETREILNNVQRAPRIQRYSFTADHAVGSIKTRFAFKENNNSAQSVSLDRESGHLTYAQAGQFQKPISSSVSLTNSQTKPVVMPVHLGFDASIVTVNR